MNDYNIREFLVFYNMNLTTPLSQNIHLKSDGSFWK